MRFLRWLDALIFDVQNRMRNIRSSADRDELFSKVGEGQNGDPEKLV